MDSRKAARCLQSRMRLTFKINSNSNFYLLAVSASSSGSVLFKPKCPKKNKKVNIRYSVHAAVHLYTNSEQLLFVCTVCVHAAVHLYIIIVRACTLYMLLYVCTRRVSSCSLYVRVLCRCCCTLVHIHCTCMYMYSPTFIPLSRVLSQIFKYACVSSFGDRGV